MSLVLVPSGDCYKFKSRERLRRFLGLESLYNTCLECALPRSKYTSEDSVRAISKSETEISDLLNRLVKSAVPSQQAAYYLNDLSLVVICKRKLCRQQAPHLYKTWCDKLWKHYLLEHKLKRKDCGSRPIEFTKKAWESALEEDDSASDSTYWSNNDNPYSDPDYKPATDSDIDSDDESDTGEDDESDTGEDDESDTGEDDESDTGEDDESDTGGDDESDTGEDEPEDSSDEDDNTNGDDDTSTETLRFGSLSIKSKARPKTKLARPKIKPAFKKYRPLSLAAQRKELFNLMTGVILSKDNRCQGYIYGYRQPGLDGYIKIGYVKEIVENNEEKAKNIKEKVKNKPRMDPVKNRLVRWEKDCEHEVEQVFRTKIECDAIQRIESLIHKTLHNYRRVQDPPCEQCRKRNQKQDQGVKHNEWFEVDEDTANKVVNFWARFAQVEPYKHGRLSSFWHQDINYQTLHAEFPEDYPVMSWMEAMTPLVELLAERESPERWVV